MLKYIKGDITEVESGIICQQVNCQGVMGSGLAKAIRDKWPIVFDDYKSYIERADIPTNCDLLGDWVITTISGHPSLYVGSIFGQVTYGRDSIKYTNYAALFAGLRQLIYDAKHRGLNLYVPKNIGCGLAHGNWEFVEQYLEDLSEMYDKDIYIVEKE